MNTSVRNISLQECPAELREAVEKELENQDWPWELLSVTLHEETPFYDKTVILRTHQAILCKANTFMVLDYMEDGTWGSGLTKGVFTLGTLKRLMAAAPEWMGLHPADVANESST